MKVHPVCLPVRYRPINKKHKATLMSSNNLSPCTYWKENVTSSFLCIWIICCNNLLVWRTLFAAAAHLNASTDTCNRPSSHSFMHFYLVYNCLRFQAGRAQGHRWVWGLWFPGRTDPLHTGKARTLGTVWPLGEAEPLAATDTHTAMSGLGREALQTYPIRQFWLAVHLSRITLNSYSTFRFDVRSHESS